MFEPLIGYNKPAREH